MQRQHFSSKARRLTNISRTINTALGYGRTIKNHTKLHGETWIVGIRLLPQVKTGKIANAPREAPAATGCTQRSSRHRSDLQTDRIGAASARVYLHRRSRVPASRNPEV